MSAKSLFFAGYAVLLAYCAFVIYFMTVDIATPAQAQSIARMVYDSTLPWAALVVSLWALAFARRTA